MKSLYILISLSLITFSFGTITFGLGSGQSVQSGSNVEITLTATNDDSTAVTFTAVTGLILSDGSNQVTIDCSRISSTEVGASGSATITCSLASISAGTYTLAGQTPPQITVGGTSTDAATSNTNSLTVTAAQQQEQQQEQ